MVEASPRYVSGSTVISSVCVFDLILLLAKPRHGDPQMGGSRTFVAARHEAHTALIRRMATLIPAVRLP